MKIHIDPILTRRLRPSVALCGLLTALSTSSLAAAADRFVELGGTNPNGCTSQQNPCGSIAIALAAANANDRIVVGAGTFLEHALEVDVPLTLQGAGAGVTIVDAQLADRHLLVNADFTLRDLTLKRGNVGSDDGGAIEIESGAVEVRDVEINESNAEHGGAINCVDDCSGLTVTRSSFDANTANEGGAINVEGADLAVRLSTFSNNGATAGGGIDMGDGIATVSDCLFSGNGASLGAGYFASLTGVTRILRSTFVQNVASTAGGGVFSSQDELLSIVNSTFSENFATARGGAINIGSTLVSSLANLTLVDNASASGAGDINADAGVVTLANSILTHPNAGQAGPECGGNQAQNLLGTSNLIDGAISCAGAAAGFRRGRIANGALGTFDLHGGPTPTYLVVPTGGGVRDPVDAVVGGCINPNTGNVIDNDQRGEPRPIGPGSTCTIGAVEI